MIIKTPIVDGLNEYLSKNHKPWHMPGHKRKSGEDIEKLNNVEKIIRQVQTIDVTEVPGLDDLHCPQEMIRESEKQLARIYGTEASYYLVNGSTCGIFAAIAACGRGGIIVADNCHKSVRNAAELMGISVSYVNTERIKLDGKIKNYRYDVGYSLRGYVTSSELEKACELHPDATAVVITSPTYEGVISDIEGLSRVAEKYGMYLIVDEAHGAHLPFMQPQISAIYNGADIVIQSLHKTLASLTQTAILHITDKAVEKINNIKEEIQRYLSFVMSSSPSYVLMASMELAVRDAAVRRVISCSQWLGDKENDFKSYINIMLHFRKKCEKLKNIRVFAGGEGYDIDITRLVLYVSQSISGPELEKMLADENIIVEMSGLDYVVLISSYVDNEADFVDLFDALQKIDGKITEKSEKITMEEYGNMLSGVSQSNETDGFDLCDKKTDYSCLDRLKVGDRSVRDVYVYPPGIPIIARGEIVTEEALSELKNLEGAGKRIHMS